MVKIKQGNILEANEDIIIHQVNAQGIMSGGVARQLANQYKYLEDNYRLCTEQYCNDYTSLRGETYLYVSEKIIANMFSQKPNFDTDYKAMLNCLNEIKQYAKKNKKTVCIPYRDRLWNCKWVVGRSIQNNRICI